MMRPRGWEAIQERLRPEHFAIIANARIYAAMLSLVEKGKQATPVTLKPLLEQDPEVEALGGMKYVVQLMTGNVLGVNVVEYADLIRDTWTRRQIIAIGDQMVASAYDTAAVTPAEIVEDSESALHALANGHEGESRLVPLATAVAEATDQIHAAKYDGKPVGFRTGLRGLDRITGGFRPGHFVILGGRPSMGKTGLATGWMHDAAQEYAILTAGERKAQVMFSVEMPRDEQAVRIACARTGIPSEKARDGTLDMVEYQQLMDARAELSALPIYIDDSAVMTTATIRSRVRHLQRREEIAAVWVDYLQLLTPTREERHDSRTVEVGNMSRNLKAIAKELGVPIIALCQLARSVEQRTDKRPQLADLRESGNIEQDADLVMFIFRAAYYHARTRPQRVNFDNEGHFHQEEAKWLETMERVREEAEVILAKNRHGPIGTAKARFEETCVRFSNPA